MMSWVKCCVFPLVLLCMWQLQEGAQACRCPYDHPQTQFCQSDVAIKAKVISEAAGEFEYDVTYDIKLTKILKGPIGHYDTICTASSSAACGVTLNKGVEYFITGQLKSDGSLRVSSCNYVVPWKSSHDTLVEHFMMGCDCKITRCSSVPCGIGSPTECLWTNAVDEQEKQSACIKKSDGSCCWYSEGPNGH